MKAIILAAMMILALPLAYADEFVHVECTYRTACDAGETCWYSISGTTNAHVGACNEYSTKMCCTKTVSAEIKPACSQAEQPLLAISQLTNNAHAEEYFTFYNNYVCIGLEEGLLLDVDVADRLNAPDNFECILGMSATTNAHAGDCAADPYAFGLYARSLAEISAENTVSVRLNVASTSDILYIPGTGELQYSDIGDNQYPGSNPYFVAITQSNQVYGIIAPEGETRAKRTAKAAGQYSVEVEQGRGNNAARVVFTKGPLDPAREQAVTSIQGESVESYGQVQTDPQDVQLGLQYDNIQFRNSGTLQKGNYELKLEHIGTRDRAIVLKVDTVQR